MKKIFSPTWYFNVSCTLTPLWYLATNNQLMLSSLSSIHSDHHLHHNYPHPCLIIPPVHHSHGHHHHPHHVIMGGGSATIAQWKTSVLPSSSWKWFQCVGGGDWGWWWWLTKYKNVCIHERLRSGANADPRYDWCCLEILLSGILQKKTAHKIWVFWGNIITPIWQWLWW